MSEESFYQDKDKALNEIFQAFVVENPQVKIEDPDLLRAVISKTMDILGLNFQAAAAQLNNNFVQLPPDVDRVTGVYTYFSYTIAESPIHGQVVSVGIGGGSNTDNSTLAQHYDMMKNVVNSNEAPTRPTKH